MKKHNFFNKYIKIIVPDPNLGGSGTQHWKQYSKNSKENKIKDGARLIGRVNG